MGTSKANNGPVGNSKPIQDWNSDSVSDSNQENGNSNHSESNEDDQQTEDEKVGKWGDAKRGFAVFIKNPTKTNYKQFSKNYVKASGGNKKLSKSSIGGRKGAVILLDLLTSISKDGFQETFEKYQIGDISDLRAEGAINKISELFSDIDGTDEGSAASAAAIETINKLYHDYSENPALIESLKIEHISGYLEFYVSAYIFERISIEVTKALENGQLTALQVNNAETYLKSYIDAEVNLNFANINFSSVSIREKNQIVSQIFNEAYSLI